MVEWIYMHLESLRIFRDLVETGTFSKAAQLNYLTQSAVSQQLKSLEAAVGRPLLDRSDRDLKLTPAGEVFYRTAKKIVTAYEKMTAGISAASPDSKERLRIEAIYSVGTYVLQRYLREFIRLHPDVKVDIEYRKASHICDDILRGRADLSVMAYPIKRRDIEVIALADEELVLILPRRSPLARKPELFLRDLDGQDFIAFDRGTPTRRALDKTLRGRGVKPRIKMELDNIETIKSAVSSGMGVSIVPESTVAADIRSKRFCLRRFADEKLWRPLGMLVRKEARHERAVRAFLEHLGVNGGQAR